MRVLKPQYCKILIKQVSPVSPAPYVNSPLNLYILNAQIFLHQSFHLC